MKKTFFSYTAVIEALTGIGLIFAPSRVAAILLNADINNSLEKILAMVGGVAISTLALGAWSVRSVANPSTVIKMLIFYNAAIVVVLLYGVLALGFGGIALCAVIIFHFVQTIISIRISIKSNNHKQ
jgi:hypothetical protein